MTAPGAGWRVTVSDDCIASGMCQALAPGYFAIGEDGRAHPVSATTAMDDRLLDTVASCPMEAITVHDLATGKEVFP